LFKEKIMNSKTFLYPIVAALAVLSAHASAQQPGDGVGGVDIGVRKKPGGQQVASASTDDRGNFTFANLREGEYGITFTPPKRAANNFHDPKGNAAAMLVLTAYDGKPARMVLAKNYYSNKPTNPNRLTVTGRDGKPTHIGFMWDSGSGTVTADPANARVMKLTYPVAPNEVGFKCAVGGCTVTGQLVLGPPAK
jgi:hemolysin activation/secretion protein